ADDGVTLTVVLSRTPEGDVVEHHAIVTDHRGFTDYHSGAVVDEKASANLRPWMNLHPGKESTQRGDYSSQEAQTEPGVQPVRDPVDEDSVQGRVTEDNLQPTMSGRIIALDRANIVSDGSKHGFLLLRPVSSDPMVGAMLAPRNAHTAR